VADRDLLSFGGPDVEPIGSRAWELATPIQRRAYYDRLGWLLRDELSDMLAAGRGFDGRYLRKRKHPRRDGATGRPITPHNWESRAHRLMAHFPHSDRVKVTWKPSGRLSWRMVMEAHTRGAGNLPVRKVAGLAGGRVERAVSKARQEWAANHPWDRLPPGGALPQFTVRRPIRPLVPFQPMLDIPAARRAP
jgi:hypothetical protein